MNHFPLWLRTVLTGKPVVPVLFSYPFLLVLLFLVYQQVCLQVQFPQYTASHLPGFFLVGALVLLHLAFSFSWGSASVRAVLRIAAFAWLFIVWAFLLARLVA